MCRQATGRSLRAEVEDGTSTVFLPPTLMDWPRPLAEISVSDGVFMCGRSADGLVYCAGFNDVGQLGDGTPVKKRAEPAPTVPMPLPAVQVTAGGGGACARLSDDSVWCWGHNNDGAVGAGAPVQRTPVQVPACP